MPPPAAAASTPGARDAVVGSAWRSALAVTSYDEMRRVSALARDALERVASNDVLWSGPRAAASGR